MQIILKWFKSNMEKFNTVQWTSQNNIPVIKFSLKAFLFGSGKDISSDYSILVYYRRKEMLWKVLLLYFVKLLYFYV